MNNSPLWSTQDVVERFVEALGGGDIEIAEHLLAKDVVYARTAARTMCGRVEVATHLRQRERSGVLLEAVLLSVTADDRIASTERVNALVYGPLRLQFAVRAKFEVRDGRIVAWTDRVRSREVATAAARALAGAVYAPIRPRLPRAAL